MISSREIALELQELESLEEDNESSPSILLASNKEGIMVIEQG